MGFFIMLKTFLAHPYDSGELPDSYEFKISTHKQLCKRHMMERLCRNANINVLFSEIDLNKI